MRLREILNLLPAYLTAIREIKKGIVPDQLHAILANVAQNTPADPRQGRHVRRREERGGVHVGRPDFLNWPQVWDLAAAFGKSGAKYYTSAGAMMEKVASGEHLLAYNIFGSYALLRAKKDPNVGIVYPKDYTLGILRIALIPKVARHQNAAKLFLDYLLSRPGQNLMANQSVLHSLRSDVEGEATAAMLCAEARTPRRSLPRVLHAVLRRPEHQEDKRASRAEGQGDHGGGSQDVFGAVATGLRTSAWVPALVALGFATGSCTTSSTGASTGCRTRGSARRRVASSLRPARERGGGYRCRSRKVCFRLHSNLIQHHLFHIMILVARLLAFLHICIANQLNSPWTHTIEDY